MTRLVGGQAIRPSSYRNAPLTGEPVAPRLVGR